MQEYISKQHQIFRPAEQIFAAISRFDHLTPALADKVEEWQADADTCSFKVKGFTLRLRIEERVEPKHVKITADQAPMDFAFWIQLHSVSADDTRLRIVVHTDMNMMMKMMIGGKLQEGVDKIAEGLATAFNQAPRW